MVAAHILSFFALTPFSLAIVGPASGGDTQFDDETLVAFVDSLKEIEEEYNRLEAERVASFPQGVQQALFANDTGAFSYPPDCSRDKQVMGYAFCFHGVLNEGNTTSMDAMVNFYDIENARDNTVIGMKASYSGNGELQTSSPIDGGGAEIMSFGERSKVACTIYLKTFVEDLSDAHLLGGSQTKNFIAEPRFRIYGLNMMLLDIDVGQAQVGYVYGGDNYQLGYNVSASVEQSVGMGISVAASVSLTLQATGGTLHNWQLLGRAQVSVKTPFANFDFPYDYINAQITV